MNRPFCETCTEPLRRSYLTHLRNDLRNKVKTTILTNCPTYFTWKKWELYLLFPTHTHTHRCQVLQWASGYVWTNRARDSVYYRQYNKNDTQATDSGYYRQCNNTDTQARDSGYYQECNKLTLKQQTADITDSAITLTFKHQTVDITDSTITLTLKQQTVDITESAINWHSSNRQRILPIVQ
jgi:hypothetical protein